MVEMVAAVNKKSFKTYLKENAPLFYFLELVPIKDEDEESSDFKRDDTKKAYDKEIEKNDREKGDNSINKSKITNLIRVVNAAS